MTKWGALILSLLLAGPAWGAQAINGDLIVKGTINYCQDVGTVNAVVCVLNPAITTYRPGQRVSFKAANTNTTVVAINVNSVGSRTIKKMVAGVLTDLAANDIGVGQDVDLMYDGTFFQVLSLGSGSGGGSSAFSALTTGSNTTATMTLGSGASLLPAGTGTVTANRVQQAASFVAANAGELGYDTTATQYHFYVNGVDRIIPYRATSTPTNSNCVSWGAAGLLQDSGSACGGSGANTSLSNLSSVNINSSLLAQTGVNLGSTTKPFGTLTLVGLGTYGTNYWTFSGTPTGTRAISIPDASVTLLGGTGAANRVCVYTTANNCDGSSSLTWDGTNLGIGSGFTATFSGTFTANRIINIRDQAGDLALTNGVVNIANNCAKWDSAGRLNDSGAPCGGGGGSGTVNTGSAGHFAYYPSTGTTVDDATSVVLDDANTAVGIGQTTPTYNLDVKGTGIASAGPLRIGPNPSDSSLQFWTINQFGSLAANAPAGSAGWLAFGLQAYSGDSFGRLGFGLDTGVPWLGFGPGSTARDVFLYRSGTSLSFQFGTTPAEKASLSNVGILTLGVAGTNVGGVDFKNATSGTISLRPVTGALGTVTVSIPAATDTLVAKATTDTLTNKTYDAEGTGNVLSIPMKRWYPAAGCNDTAASSVWDLFGSGNATPICVTGTNTQKGVLQFIDTGGSHDAQITDLLPADWTTTGGVDAKIIWSTGATTGNAKWYLSTACTDVAATATDDPSFQAAGNATTAAPGTANRIQTSSITGLTMTGCTTATNMLFHLKVLRDGADAADTIAATANLIGIELTFRRAI